MLTLITGSLGTGKTALMVKLLTEHSSYPDNAVVVGVNRPDNRGGYLVKVKYPSMSYYPGFVGSFLQPDVWIYSGFPSGSTRVFRLDLLGFSVWIQWDLLCMFSTTLFDEIFSVDCLVFATTSRKSHGWAGLVYAGFP